MLPLKDDNPTRTAPVVTVLIILANVLVFAYQLMLPPRAEARFLRSFGAIPALVVSDPFGGPGIAPAASLLTSMFLHGSFLHLGGNMLYLWIFGNNIEDAVGHLRFIVFYFLCGIAAHALQIATSLASTVPTIGASGAIAGVLGAYIVLYPGARVLAIVPFGFLTRVVWVPAFFVLGLWFVIQFLNGLPSLGGEALGGVAWFAHVGGFVAGMVLVRVFAGRSRRRASWGGGI